MDKNEVNISISEIDNGYMLHAAKTGYLSDTFVTNRAIVGSKSDAGTACALLQALCEEVMSLVMMKEYPSKKEKTLFRLQSKGYISVTKNTHQSV